MNPYTAPGVLKIPKIINTTIIVTSPEDIITISCKVFKITRDEIVISGKRKHGKKFRRSKGKHVVSDYRSITTYMLKAHSSLRQNDIGKLLEIDHSTVVSRLRRANDILTSKDESYSTIIKQAELIRIYLNQYALGINDFMTD